MANSSYLERLLGENEKILHISRQHWFVLTASIVLEIAITLAVFSGIIYVIALSVWALPLALGLGFILMLLPLISMIHDILVFTNRQYIITNWRVLQIAGIINKSITDSSLEKVNDVKMTQSFFGRIFNYGDIEIMTASEMGINSFKRIADPISFKTAMLNAKDAFELRLAGGDREDAAPTGSDPLAMLAQLGELKAKGVITDAEFLAKKAELLAKVK